MAGRPKQREGESHRDVYVTLPLLYEKLESITAQNRAEHQEIRLEISRGLSEVKDTNNELQKKISLNSERLIKVESTPAHEKFQTQFCPNTKGLTEVAKWISDHKDVHKEIMGQLRHCEDKIDNFVGIIREDRDGFEKERLRLQLENNRRLKWAIIAMLLTIAGSIVLRSMGY